MKMNLYLVTWSNSHASGIFPEVFTSKAKASEFGRSWKSEMVAEDDNPKEARQEYVWEILTCPFFVERDWGAWLVFDKDSAPRCAIVKACPFKHVKPSLVEWLKEEVRKPKSEYIRLHSIYE